MSVLHTPTHAVPASARTLAADLVRTSPERGRRMILWGWTTTMAGVACYCRVIFALGPEAEIMDAVMKSGALGWLSALLSISGIGLWMGGNLVYMLDATRSTPADPAEEDGPSDPAVAP